MVFSILRNALGTGQIPNGTVVTALSILLSLYVMAPVGSAMIAAATPEAADVDVAAPLAHPDALVRAIRAGAEPLREFLVRNAGTRERGLFLELAREARPEEQRAELSDTDFLVAAPAFVVTELGEALQIGFLVFLPFLIVDLVIANVLTALGLSSLSPTQVSLPFKLLLFVMVPGDARSGEFYVYDRKKGTFWLLSLADSVFGGYSLVDMRQKIKDFRLLDFAEDPSRLRAAKG